MHEYKKVYHSLTLNYARIENSEFIAEIKEGNTVTYNFFQDFEAHKKFLKIFHQTIPCILFQRGNLVLHGSAFSFKNKAILLLGQSGTGKSESAYQLSKNHKIITDDVVCIENKGNSIYCKNGFNFLSVKENNSDFNLNEKRGRSLVVLNEDKTTSSELKIEQIFFLNWGNQNSIIEMDDSQAFKALLANAFRPISSVICHDSERHFLRTQLAFLNQVKKYFFFRKKGDIKESLGFLNNFLEKNA